MGCPYGCAGSSPAATKKGYMRITPEEIVEAYKKTGLTPARGTFVSGKMACGLGAYARSKGFDGYFVANFLEGMGITANYRTGFISGFDDTELCTCCAGLERDAAYKDGEAAWEASRSLM